MKSPLKRIYTSFDDVTKAYNKVRMELWNLDVLWNGSKLDGVECIYEPIDLLASVRGWMGYFDYNDKNIHFPSIYLSNPFNWVDKNSAVDVLRHEFGHALMDRYYRPLALGSLFRTAFGGPHGATPAPGFDPYDWEDRCVSGYAATQTKEDFAETFMLFVKHKGRIPSKFAKKPALRKKWKAVAEICRRVAAENR